MTTETITLGYQGTLADSTDRYMYVCVQLHTYIIIRKYTYIRNGLTVFQRVKATKINQTRTECRVFCISVRRKIENAIAPRFRPIVFISSWSMISQNSMGFSMICRCLRLAPERYQVVSGLPRAGAGWECGQIAVKSFGHVIHV